MESQSCHLCSGSGWASPWLPCLCSCGSDRPERRIVVVGLAGLRGSGKDTGARFLLEQGWHRIAFGDALYAEIATAFGVTVEFLENRERKELPQPELALKHCKDPLFVEVVLAIDRQAEADTNACHWMAPALALFGLARTATRESLLSKPRSPRQTLQYWATEYRRHLFGSDYWRRQVKSYIEANPNEKYVIPDVRFPDEAHLIEQDLQGVVARVIRPALSLEDPNLLHISERAMLDYPVDREFINLDGPDGQVDFRRQVLGAYGKELELA